MTNGGFWNNLGAFLRYITTLLSFVHTYLFLAPEIHTSHLLSLKITYSYSLMGSPVIWFNGTAPQKIWTWLLTIRKSSHSIGHWACEVWKVLFCSSHQSSQHYCCKWVHSTPLHGYDFSWICTVCHLGLHLQWFKKLGDFEFEWVKTIFEAVFKKFEFEFPTP